MFFKKKKIVPKSNETEHIEAVKLWYVSWVSRHGRFFDDTSKEIEAFPREEDANRFAESLRNAFKLIRHTSDTRVQIYVRESDQDDNNI